MLMADNMVNGYPNNEFWTFLEGPRNHGKFLSKGVTPYNYPARYIRLEAPNKDLSASYCISLVIKWLEPDLKSSYYNSEEGVTLRDTAIEQDLKIK